MQPVPGPLSASPLPRPPTQDQTEIDIQKYRIKMSTIKLLWKESIFILVEFWGDPKFKKKFRR